MERISLHILRLGAIAIAIAASPTRAFDLDRFLVPKEIVLHATALLAGLFALRSIRRLRGTWIDVLLAAFLIAGCVSAFFATNPWLAFRALAVTASGLLLFWTARALRDAGFARPLLNALAFAVILVAASSLLQAYGVRLDLFSPNRSPGGTLGNRNAVAHAAAFGLPLCVLAAVRARHVLGSLFALTGVAILMAALVLTRSRAGWLAAAIAIVILLAAMIVWRRGILALVFAAGGVVAALLIPNTLRWASDNPYLDSVAGIAEFEEGSGRGRLIQYERSLRMAAAYPIFGVGPGNWPVIYPDYAGRGDPSIDRSEPGTTFNPWPSSDWIAYVSERGFAAAALLALAVAGILAGGGIRTLKAADEDDGFEAAALLACAAAALIAGLFDAVLLLALPALIVWSAIGALWRAGEPNGSGTRAVIAFLAIVIAAAGVVRSTAQLVAMEIYATTNDRSLLRRAALIDPANYRLRVRLARIVPRDERCEHALAARDLFPNASAARELAARCE